MKKIIIVVLMFVLTSLPCFTQTDLATVLTSGVKMLPGFSQNILPYIKNTSDIGSKEKIKIESHILPCDMTIEELIITYGVRVVEVENLKPLLIQALVSGELKGIKLTEKNLFVVSVNHKDSFSGYFVILFWSSSHKCWALDAHPMGEVYAKKGAQIFNSY